MNKSELIKKIKDTKSVVEFFKLKENIISSLEDSPGQKVNISKNEKKEDK